MTELNVRMLHRATAVRHAVAALLIATLTVACATSPTGRSQLLIVPESFAISASEDAYRQQLAPFAKKGRLDNEQAMAERVRSITSRLVAQAIEMRPETADWQWSIKVLDDPETVNAWAMAGGRMAIYSGLIEQLDPTDDELAQVLGHEIAHALARHTAEQMSTALATQLGVAALAIALDSREAFALGSVAAQVGITLPFSRTAEREADRIGIELAAKAGYDPRAAPTLWRKMQGASGEGPPQFLSTHPSPESRIEDLSALVPEMLPYYRRAREDGVERYPLSSRWQRRAGPLRAHASL
jgi:predicted Zn-dependent protease